MALGGWLVNNLAASTVSNSSPSGGAQRVPTLFVIAMIMMWLLGMHAITEGVRAIDIVRSPLSESLAPLDGDSISDAAQRAFVEGVVQHANVTLPLGIAQLLLGALLAVVSVRALFGRRGSLSFALQVVAANAVLAVVGHVLHNPVRGSVIEAIVASGIAEPSAQLERAEFDALLRTNLQWGFRFWLTAQLVGFGFVAFAVTRKSVKQLFASTSDSGR
jgi:hypothetical protein